MPFRPIASAKNLSEGGLAQAVFENSSVFNLGMHTKLDEIMEKNKIGQPAGLFSETPARILVSVGREDEVKFGGLCEQRNDPITCIGVTDIEPTLEIQDLATWKLTDLKLALKTSLPQFFA